MSKKATTSAIKDLNAQVLLGNSFSNVPYVHSNDSLRFQGSKIVREIFDEEYQVLMDQIEQTLGNWIQKLIIREEEWYHHLSNSQTNFEINNFQDFENKIWPLLLKSRVGNKDALTIEQGLEQLTSVVELNWQIRTDPKVENKSHVLASSLESTSDLVNKIDKIATEYIGDASAFTKASNGKKSNSYVNSVAQMQAVQGAAKSDSKLTVSKMVNYVSKNMGWVAEGVWTKGAEDQYNELVSERLKGIKVTHVGKDSTTIKTGKVNKPHIKGSTAGASDIVFAFDTFTVGATIKTRYQAGNKIQQIPVFGSNIDQTFNQAFAESMGTHKIAHFNTNGLSALKYLLLNYWFSNRKSKRIKDQQIFINQIRNILAYNYSLHAVLGTGWNSVEQGIDLLPLIYISGNKVYPTRAILQLILASLKKSKNGKTEPANIARSQYYGTWKDPEKMGIRPRPIKNTQNVIPAKTLPGQKKKRNHENFQPTGNLAVDLYFRKEFVLRKSDSITYKKLREDPVIQQFLEELDQEFFYKSKKIYKVSYEIKNSNIAAQAQKGA